MTKFLTLSVMLAALASPAAAQTVTVCDRWEARADNLAEPWEEMSRTFANGDVRIAVIDTIEPAAGAFHLMILSPPYSELGDRQCRMISHEGAGFAGIRFSELTAGYDPQTGLGFDLPVVLYDGASGNFLPVGLGFTLNQATGQINANIYPVD